MKGMQTPRPALRGFRGRKDSLDRSEQIDSYVADLSQVTVFGASAR
jgi:hypothetical protein